MFSCISIYADMGAFLGGFLRKIVSWPSGIVIVSDYIYILNISIPLVLKDRDSFEVLMEGINMLDQLTLFMKNCIQKKPRIFCR